MKRTALMMILSVAAMVSAAPWTPPTGSTGAVSAVSVDENGVIVTPANFKEVNNINSSTNPVAAGPDGSVQINQAGKLSGSSNFVYSAEYNAFVHRSTNGVMYRMYKNNAVADSNLIYRLANEIGKAVMRFENNGSDSLVLSGDGSILARSLTLGAITRTNWYDYSALDANIIAASNLFVSLYGEVSGLSSGSNAFEGILLDRKINSWEEIGVTYSNAARINNPITITNDSAWTGWTTTGSLTASNEILLLTGQYLLSPVQSNGVARYEVNSYSAQNGTPGETRLLSGTNEVAYPYYAQDGRLKIIAGDVLPGATAGLYVSGVTMVGYENMTEAATVKYVAGLRRTDAEIHADDMTSKRYVDAAQIAAEKHADSGLSVYAADPSKTLKADRLEMGNYTVVGSGAWQGVNFAQSADSATIGTRFDDNIITLDSGLTAVEIQGITQIGTNVTLSIYAQNIDGLPTIGVTTNLMVAFAPIAATVTDLGNGNYSAVVDVSGFGSAKGFFRAYATALPASPGAVTIHADILNLAGHRIEGVSEIVFTNGWKIACTTNGLEFVQP